MPQARPRLHGVCGEPRARDTAWCAGRAAQASPLSSFCSPLLAVQAGACLGTGIERGKVGDILVTGEQGAQILCAPNLVEHLEGALTQVGWGGGWGVVCVRVSVGGGGGGGGLARRREGAGRLLGCTGLHRPG